MSNSSKAPAPCKKVPRVDASLACAEAIAEYLRSLSFTKSGGYDADEDFCLEEVFCFWPSQGQQMKMPCAAVMPAGQQLVPPRTWQNRSVLEPSEHEQCGELVHKYGEIEMNFDVNIFCINPYDLSAVSYGIQYALNRSQLDGRLGAPAYHYGIELRASDKYLNQPIEVKLLSYQVDDDESNYEANEHRGVIRLSARTNLIGFEPFEKAIPIARVTASQSTGVN